MMMTPDVVAQANQKSQRLRELVRAPEILVMPGAYDTLSALLFESMGFSAIQGTSGGIAAVHGLRDGTLGLDRTVEACRAMVELVKVPLNADGEKGFGGPEQVAETVRRLVEIGVAGLNLEDGAERRAGEAPHLVELSAHQEKIEAFFAARRELGSEFFLNARVDAFLVMEDRRAALAEAVARGNAYAEMGADCVFYIRAGGPETIATLAREVQAPVSILADTSSPSVQQLEDLGVARVSYGAAFTRAALSGAKRFAEVVLAKGDPRLILEASISTAELNHLFTR